MFVVFIKILAESTYRFLFLLWVWAILRHVSFLAAIIAFNASNCAGWLRRRVSRRSFLWLRRFLGSFVLWFPEFTLWSVSSNFHWFALSSVHYSSASAAVLSMCGSGR